MGTSVWPLPWKQSLIEVYKFVKIHRYLYLFFLFMASVKKFLEKGLR
jgi:hypothetical protein